MLTPKTKEELSTVFGIPVFGVLPALLLGGQIKTLLKTLLTIFFFKFNISSSSLLPLLSLAWFSPHKHGALVFHRARAFAAYLIKLTFSERLWLPSC